MVTSVRLISQKYYSDWQDIARVRLVSDFPRSIGKNKRNKKKNEGHDAGDNENTPSDDGGLYSYLPYS
jgi:hypothetical protein